jgi:hypothetical protein
MIVAMLATGFLAAASIPAGAAVAPAAASTSLSSASPTGPFTVTTPQGELTYGWRPLSAGEIVPDSASGCDHNACISIVGTSNYVTTWNTTAYYYGNGTLCTIAAWHANDIIVHSSRVICGTGAGAFYSDWTPKEYFASPTKACNGWTHVKGYPCEEITR